MIAMQRTPMQSGLFGGIFYINLDRRTDRRAEIEAELASHGFDGAERFAAIPWAKGLVGCGYSHMAVLKEARRRGLKNVLIFEDDFQFLVGADDVWKNLRAFFEGPDAAAFDVLMLSYNLFASEPHSDVVVRARDVQTASGYVVAAHMYDRLIELYEWAMPLLDSTWQHWIYANDQIWKRFQGGDGRWFAFKERLGRQRPSITDCGEGWADHGC